MSNRAAGFFVAPFGTDGEPEGLDRWELSELSHKWLTICGEFLEHYGDCFDAAWSGPLSHIETRFTSAAGAALVTFRVRGRPVSISALAKGQSPQAESEVLNMFVESLRRINLVKAAATSPEPFQKVLNIEERPLMIVVPWPDAEVSDQDHELVRELELHTAGAFFTKDS